MALLGLMLPVGCRDGDSTGPPPEGVLLREAAERVTVRASAPIGRIFMVTMGIHEASAAGRLNSVEVAGLDPGVELLEVRAHYARRLENGKAVEVAGSEPGAVCLDTYPPAGYGPSRPARGFALGKGDVVGLTIIARPIEPGDFTLEGLQLTFRDDDGELRRQTVRSRTLMIFARSDAADYPDVQPCSYVPSIWTMPLGATAPSK